MNKAEWATTATWIMALCITAVGWIVAIVIAATVFHWLLEVSR